MFARVMTSTVKPQAIELAVAEWPSLHSVIQRERAYRWLSVPRPLGLRFLSITVWESEEAQRRNSISPEQVHGRAEFSKHLTGSPVPSTYDVVATVL